VLIRKVFVLGLVLFLSMVAGAGAQLTFKASGPVQRFATAMSNSLMCINPPFGCAPLASLPIDLNADSYLTITFSASGEVLPSSTAFQNVTIKCDVDGKPCEAGGGITDFAFPKECCDSRSFTWIAFWSKGAHTVNITWTAPNMGTTIIHSRTLNVDAIAM
jgi:hypothetical protein